MKLVRLYNNYLSAFSSSILILTLLFINSLTKKNIYNSSYFTLRAQRFTNLENNRTLKILCAIFKNITSTILIHDYEDNNYFNHESNHSIKYGKLQQ